MSNCVTLHRGNEIKLHKDDIDLPGLLACISMHEEHRRKTDYGWTSTHEQHGQTSDESLCCYVTFWFLDRKHITEGPENVLITLGKYEHTWRDFRQVLWFISQFITRDVWLTFVLEDEGFPGKFDLSLHLVPQKWPVGVNGEAF